MNNIFVDVLFGKKDIYIKQNDKYVVLYGKTTCTDKTKSVSERANVQLVKYDHYLINLISFKIKTDYLYKNNLDTIEGILYGQIDIYLLHSSDRLQSLDTNTYLSYCSNGNITLSTYLRDARFRLEIDGLTGNLELDIINTLSGINNVRFKRVDVEYYKSLPKYLGNNNNNNNNNIELTNNINNANFKIYTFHPEILKCCRNIGTKEQCQNYFGKTKQCDEIIIDYCSLETNKNKKECSCFNSTLYPQECLDKRCQNKNVFITSDMTNSCKNVDINCIQYASISNKQDLVNNKLYENKCKDKQINISCLLFGFNKMTIYMLIVLLLMFIFGLFLAFN